MIAGASEKKKTMKYVRSLASGLGALAALAAITSTVACSKSGSEGTATTSDAATSASGAAATGAASGHADAKGADAGPKGADAKTPGAGEAKAGAAAGEATSFNAKYTLAPAPMYVPSDKEYAGVKFKNDETKMVGDGTLNLTIEPSGRVSGTSEGGPLGAAIIEGTQQGDLVTANVRRKDALDEGLTGTLSAKRTGDKLEGTIKLSEFTAAVVREAKFTAEKAGK